MTLVYITIDTEYAAGLAVRDAKRCRSENFAHSIACVTAAGSVGLAYQMDVLDLHGLKAVFFVDPMPALLWGVDSIADVVGPIVERGHDVQLHLHTEWLELAGAANPLGGRTGANMKDFTIDEQCILLDYARAVLIAAGAPRPVAFRAGNYGANDDTLRALAQVGIAYDTSHAPGIAGSRCDISLGPEDRMPVEHCGVMEVPIGCIAAAGQRLRHAQLTALTCREFLGAIDQAAASGAESFTLVSHSFELLSRDRKRINRIVKRRFERFCAALERHPVARTATYRDSPPRAGVEHGPVPILPHSFGRTGLRLVEQALGNALYGAR